MNSFALCNFKRVVCKCFRNVVEKQLTESLMLIDIGRKQAVMTSLITDINFDSKNEILLGTYEHVKYIKHLSLKRI